MRFLKGRIGYYCYLLNRFDNVNKDVQVIQVIQVIKMVQVVQVVRMICIQKIYGFQGLIHQIIEES